MDDTLDDARYLPNHPYPSICRRPFSSSSSSSASSTHRSKISAARKSSFPPPIGRRYADEDDEDEQNDMDEAVDEHDDDEDENDGGGRHRQIWEDDDEEEEAKEDSAESRGKRRKLDKFVLGFEFARRVPRPAIVTPEGKFPGKSSPTDWSEDSTFVLLDAWGNRYAQNGRKSLRSDEWSEVAKKVSQSSKTTLSDAQCRNRLDTLKKKYKKEKVRMAERASPSSKWVYFKKMDELISSPPATGARRQQPRRMPCGVDAGEYVFASSNVYRNRSNGNDEMRDSPGYTGSEEGVDEEEEGVDEEEDGDESGGLPPRRKKVSMGSSDSSFRMLADSIQKFGEVYEKMESRKRQQMAELERMREEFQRDLEMHKRKILERAQVEIANIREEEGEEEEEKSEDDEDGDDEIDLSAENLSG